MTRKLQFLMMLLLMIGGVTSAWAEDYDGKSPVYSPTNGTNYATFAAAMSAFDGLADGSSFEIHLYADVALASRVTVTKSKSLTIVPKAAVSISRGSVSRTTMWFLNNSTGTLTLGSSDYAITFAGAGHADNERIFKNILGNEKAGRINIENVTFQNFKFDTENSNLGYLFLNQDYNGKLVLKNVTVSNCITTEDAFIKSISTNNDCIYLQGAINFDNCTGTDIYATARIRLGEVDGSSSTTISASTPISIYWANTTTAINTPVVVKATSAMVSNFTLTNENLGLFGNNTDLKLTQAYTLSVSEAGAATLVLPFESTIPTGATCYDLTYSSGDNIDAASVTTTLAKDKAVLVMANEGSYKFVSTATKSGEAATGSGQTSANGVLIGNYDANYVVPTTSDSKTNYILSYKDSQLGFRKANGTNKVQPYRAYMGVTHSSGGSNNAPAYYSIIFPGDGDNGTTAIMAVDVEEPLVDDGEIYNLQGVRMTGSNLPKGIYVKNGKKFVIK